MFSRPGARVLRTRRPSCHCSRRTRRSARCSSDRWPTFPGISQISSSFATREVEPGVVLRCAAIPESSPSCFRSRSIRNSRARALAGCWSATACKRRRGSAHAASSSPRPSPRTSLPLASGRSRGGGCRGPCLRGSCSGCFGSRPGAGCRLCSGGIDSCCSTSLGNKKPPARVSRIVAAEKEEGHGVDH
jgi:hypothetical protein